MEGGLFIKNLARETLSNIFPSKWSLEGFSSVEDLASILFSFETSTAVFFSQKTCWVSQELFFIVDVFEFILSTRNQICEKLARIFAYFETHSNSSEKKIEHTQFYDIALIRVSIFSMLLSGSKNPLVSRTDSPPAEHSYTFCHIVVLFIFLSTRPLRNFVDRRFLIKNSFLRSSLHWRPFRIFFS